ncbi:type IV toxin-antitoxin system AbiEi family antitoxin [Hymenobacter aerilatus]|uniref:type IV toxin-antitoxin system AbiEi family antitoxin n=1 Tax=Hymenobacter aerilatus TaxID=2932251 RepID=UPI0035C9F8F9
MRNRLNPQRYRWLTAAPPTWPYPLPAGCVWSGEAAAQRLLGLAAAPPPLLMLYSTLPRAQLAHQLQLVPCQRGPVELLNPYFLPLSPDLEQCAPPLVVYADLLAAATPRAAALAQDVKSCVEL